MTREKIQSEALEALKKNNYTGIIVLSVGSGKSKVAVDAIKEGNFKNILITSPRTNLKENWKKELNKWLGKDILESDAFPDRSVITCNSKIIIENIQTCYKWSKERISQFDVIIIDEIHTTSEKYFQLIENASCPIIGLTGTPDENNEFKKNVLYQRLPIIYKYLDSEKDNIVNKIKYWIYRYELSDDFKINRTVSWKQGEKSYYEYLDKTINDTKSFIKNHYFESVKVRTNNRIIHNSLFAVGKLSDDEVEFLKDIVSKDLDYFYSKIQESFDGMTMTPVLYAAIKDIKHINYSVLGTNCLRFLSLGFSDEVKSKFIKYNWAINQRKKFLLTLKYNQSIVKNIKDKILSNPDNKVLIFSELTEQASLLSDNTIHSKTGNSTKESKLLNKETLLSFDKGEIREVSSCQSLTLGLNINKANWAIFESYYGSDTNRKQKAGRCNRLNTNEVANIIVLVPINTQSEVWFEKAFPDINEGEVIYVNNIDEIIYES